MVMMLFIYYASPLLARRKNPPSRGAGCALQQECRRGSKPRQLPTTKHSENSSIIFIAAHQKSQTTRSCKFLSVLAPKSIGRVFGSWRSTTTTKNHHYYLSSIVSFYLNFNIFCFFLVFIIIFCFIYSNFLYVFAIFPSFGFLSDSYV